MGPFLSLSDVLSFDPGMTELPVLVFQITPYFRGRPLKYIGNT